MTVLPSLAPRFLVRGAAALALAAGLALSCVPHPSASSTVSPAALSPVVGDAAEVASANASVVLAAHATPVARAASRLASPPCPSADTLFSRLSGAATGGAKATLMSKQVACSGDWAVIGVGLQRPGAPAGTRVQTVQLFRYVSGAWHWRDSGNACSAGLVPAALVPSVCNAG